MAEVENGAGWCGFLERVIFAGQPWASLTFSQILRFVRRSPVASRLGCGLPGRKLSRLTPTNVGTLCAFLTGREKCGLVEVGDGRVEEWKGPPFHPSVLPPLTLVRLRNLHSISSQDLVQSLKQLRNIKGFFDTGFCVDIL